MKRLLILSTLAALLGGCAIVPVGYGYNDNRDGYNRERGYDRGDGNYWGYGYRGDRDNRGGYRDHGG
jgi:opacity protein-like surface antigen